MHLLDNPDATLEELMEFVPGPDLPVRRRHRRASTASRMPTRRAAAPSARVRRCRSSRSARDAPDSSSPSCRTWSVPSASSRRSRMPSVAKKLQGIADVTDLTDRHHGLRLVIGIKTGFDPQAVLEQLYRLTPLEDSFGINNVALVDGQPQTLGLRDAPAGIPRPPHRGRDAAQPLPPRASQRSACTSSRACSSRSSTSTRSSRSSAPPTTANRPARA